MKFRLPRDLDAAAGVIYAVVIGAGVIALCIVLIFFL